MNKKIYLISFAVLCIFILNACFTDWSGGEGTITLNFGSGKSGARQMLTPNDKVEEFTHRVTLRNSANKIIAEEDFTGTSGTMSVPAGSYTVIVKGYELIEDDNTLRSYGIYKEGALVRVNSGQNTTLDGGIDMYSAVEVGPDNDLQVIFDEGPTDERMLYVLINDDISLGGYGWNIGSGNFTLIAEEKVIIDCSEFNLASNYMIHVTGELNLGLKGMVGSITIIGAAANSRPLIDIDGVLQMFENVIIKGNLNTTPGTVYDGGGVRVGNGACFNMHGGTITGNLASRGGGVYVSEGIFNMYGGEITGNSAHNGGGVYVAPSHAGISGTFNMYGGTIAGNAATNEDYEDNKGFGGGVYVDSGSFFQIQSGVIVGYENFGSFSSNEAHTFGVALYVADDGTAQFGRFMDYNELDPNGELGSSNDTIHIVNGDRRLGELSRTFNVHNFDDWANAVNEIATRGGEALYTIRIFDDVLIPGLSMGQYTFGNAEFINVIIIDMLYYSLHLEGQGSLLRIGPNQTVDLRVSLSGVSNNIAPLVYINGAGAFLAMDEGYGINGNVNTNNGGGVHIDGGGTFTMNGGEIKNNTAQFNGGGVYITGANSTFNMLGGTIDGEGNRSARLGGGVFVGGIFNMEDGEIINNNEADYGGGVFIDSYGTFNMKGGGITGNEASQGGGGVYIDNYGNFFILNGTIIDNTVTDPDSAGADLFFEVSAKVQYGTFDDFGEFTPAGNFITEEDSYTDNIMVVNSSETWNSAAGRDQNNRRDIIIVTGDFSLPSSASSTFTGTGIRVTIRGNSTITLTGQGNLFRVGTNQTVVLEDIGLQGRGSAASNENNTSLVWVGGAGAALIMKGNSSVSGNVNTYGDGHGGGVYVASGGTFTMNGGEIVGNKAKTGAGVFLNDSTFTMKSGKIGGEDGNTATNNGGGVAVCYGATFDMEGGYIIKNNSQQGGGGIYISSIDDSSIVNIKSDSFITDNTAVGSGGGILIFGNKSRLNMFSGYITKNKAANGGGVFLNDGNFIMTGGIIGGTLDDANTVSSGNGGGVAFYNGGNGELIFGGNARVIGNTDVTATTDSNVYLEDGRFITLGTGALPDGNGVAIPVVGMEIWVLTETTSGIIVENAEDGQQNFFGADQPGHSVRFGGDNIQILALH